jgi:hypothetical protein
VLALAILFCACGHRKKPPKPPLFPELASVSPLLVSELRPQVESWSGTWGDGTTILKGIAPNGGVAAGWAILKILVQQYEGAVEFTSRSSPDSDRFAEMAATRLGDLADAELKAALQRGVAAPGSTPSFVASS